MPRVIVPYYGDDPHRRQALDFVLDRIPYPVALAHGESKAEAVMGAIEKAPADLVIVHDADVWTDLESAVLAVTAGAAQWSMPHSRVYRLTEEGTANVYAGEPWESQKLDRPSYRGIFGGGIVCAHRDTFLSVPFDPRFTGWGGEDEALGLALTALVGPPWRGRAPLPHLWHPREPKEDRRFGCAEHKALHRRYHQARRNPEAMRVLIEENR